MKERNRKRETLAEFVRRNRDLECVRKTAFLLKVLLETEREWETRGIEPPKEGDCGALTRFLAALHDDGFFLEEARDRLVFMERLRRGLKEIGKAKDEVESETRDTKEEYDESEVSSKDEEKEKDLAAPSRVSFTEDGGVIVETASGKKFYEGAISKVSPKIKGMASMIGSVLMEDGEYVPGAVHGAEKIITVGEDREKVAEFYLKYASKAG